MILVTAPAPTVTSSNMLKDMDGRTYKTVKIGSQLWMAENLKTAKYANGDPIQKVITSDIWKKLKTGAWSFYNND